jgi:hypothetical protein
MLRHVALERTHVSEELVNVAPFIYTVLFQGNHLHGNNLTLDASISNVGKGCLRFLQSQGPPYMYVSFHIIYSSAPSSSKIFRAFVFFE